MAKEKDKDKNVTPEQGTTLETPATQPTDPVDIDALIAEKVAEALVKAKEEEAAEAEAKAQAETEAEAKLREEQQKRGKELVPCFIPYVEGEPEEVTVGFNGKLYKIKKGEEVEVPRFIYEILVNSGKQRMAAHKKQEELANVELNA